MKRSSWENFQPGRDEIGSLGKNDKRKNSQKAESENVRFRSFEGREIRGQLSKDIPERKVSKRLLGKNTKIRNYEKQRRDQLPKLLAQHGLWYLREYRRGISNTPEP